MPNIDIEGPIIKGIEKKRILVKEITDAAAKAYSLPKEVFVVVIKENSPDNVGIGGKLLIDKK